MPKDFNNSGQGAAYNLESEIRAAEAFNKQAKKLELDLSEFKRQLDEKSTEYQEKLEKKLYDSELNNIIFNAEARKKYNEEIQKQASELLKQYNAAIVQNIKDQYKTEKQRTHDNAISLVESINQEKNLQADVIELKKRAQNALREEELKNLHDITQREIDAEKEKLKIEEELNKKYLDKLNEYNEKQEKKKNGKRADEAKQAQIKQKVADEQQRQQRLAQYELNDKNQERANGEMASALKYGDGNLGQKLSKFADAFNTYDKNNQKQQKSLHSILQGMKSILQSMESQMEESAKTKSVVDTAMQGSSSNKYLGSYWGYIAKDIQKVVGASLGVFKEEDYVNNIIKYAEAGRIFNIEQRAYIATVKDKIAATFEDSDATLVKLVRIQQADSTAARLGMESALTAFLNNMYETSEYMQSIASEIRGNLYESMALMSATDAVGFEYQVQKWMGSLYSVGVSDTAVSSLSKALGELTSGDISNLGSGGAYNLLIMAANQANMSLSDMLEKGLNDSETNTLLKAVVSYLKNLYGDFEDSLVLQQQISSIYGLTASDLKAVNNLTTTDTSNISSSYLNYNSALSRLNIMANTALTRSSAGEIMQNLWDNAIYGMASSIGSNPLFYTLYKTSDLLEDIASGVEFALPMVMGTGTSQTFNVADIMKVASLIPGVYSLGSQVVGAITGLNTLVSSGGTQNEALNILGINKGITTTSRGSGATGVTTSGTTTSTSGLIYNSSGSDVYSASLTSAEESTNAQIAQQTAESTEATTTMIYDSVENIYSLLAKVIDDGANINVNITNTNQLYGLQNGFTIL